MLNLIAITGILSATWLSLLNIFLDSLEHGHRLRPMYFFAASIAATYLYGQYT